MRSSGSGWDLVLRTDRGEVKVSSYATYTVARLIQRHFQKMMHDPNRLHLVRAVPATEVAAKSQKTGRMRTV